MESLKLYELDFGVYGLTVVIAESKEKAIKLFQTTYNWNEREIVNIKERIIKAGLIIENLGDR